MFAGLPVQFDKPFWLLLFLLIIPAYVVARRSIGGLTPTKAYVTLVIRTAVILLLAMALAEPSWSERGEGVTVTIILDRSQSVPGRLKSTSLDFLQRAATLRENREDRVAVITVARDANISAMPSENSAVPDEPDLVEGDLNATNLAEAIHLALAVAPDDTANRIVLASDGNETEDSVLTAADLARANNIPIDVLPIQFEHQNEVIFDRLVAPARARQGQTIKLKMAIRSQGAAEGVVKLMQNGEPLDLNGADEGEGLRVSLEQGIKLLEVPIDLDRVGAQSFRAVFEPDHPEVDDMIRQNNEAVAVTFVAGEGQVLIIEDGGDSAYLQRALQEAAMAVEVRTPDALSGDQVYLSGFDAVVLVNVPRWAFDDQLDRALRGYVHDLGGGLVMVGGPNAFGAGGWIDSELAKALPLELDPPESRVMTRGALALIMHSCEMPQGNFWGQKVATSAIEALSSRDFLGIVEFNWNPGAGGINGANWAFPMQEAGDKSAALAATKQMVVGDMPDFQSSMQLAFNGLMSVTAGQRHAIIISDGDPQPPTPAMVNQFIGNRITVTTVMVAGHGNARDRMAMKGVANATGGNFYNITNPKKLPQIFIKEAQVVSRSLIQEGDIYQPGYSGELPGPIEGFLNVPTVDGYVLTVAREGLAQVPLVNATSEGQDPIYAYWNYGLGKAIAYTSDLTGLWGSQWVGWDDFKAFWEQSIRWVMRPSSRADLLDVQVYTRQEGDRAIVEFEAVNPDASFSNFLRASARVMRPDGQSMPMSIQQIGPGRYRAAFRTDLAGPYLINIDYEAMGDEIRRRSVQAAVSVPYPKEYRAIKHNAALLHQLAALTGGRVITADDPMIADLFSREQLEIPRSNRRVWDLMAIIAACLFVIDVAARRVSVDPQRLAALLARATGRRTEASGETVAAWKRARAQVTHRRRDAGSLTAEDEPERDARFEASEEDLASAVDVGGETPGDVRDRGATPGRKPPDSKSADDDTGDYTSRLLAAKRRAKEQGEQQDKDRGDG